MTFVIQNSTGATVNYPMATATDNKELGDVLPYCHPHSGTLFPVGTTKVSCSVTDVAGNSATKTFDIVVINDLATGDTIPPKIISPVPVRMDATTANGAKVIYDLP